MARTIYLDTGETVVLVPDPDEVFVRLVEERLGRDAAAYLREVMDSAVNEVTGVSHEVEADEYYDALQGVRDVVLRLERRLMSKEGLDDVAEIQQIINKII